MEMNILTPIVLKTKVTQVEFMARESVNEIIILNTVTVIICYFHFFLNNVLPMGIKIIRLA